MDDAERHAGGLAEPHEDGQVRLAPALDDRDALAVYVDAEDTEHVGQGELLRAAFHEDRDISEEQLASFGVELAHGPEPSEAGRAVAGWTTVPASGSRLTTASSARRATLRKAGAWVV